ncbi:MAG TPA: DUF2147 domain-containing protein [Pedobacter sp.]|nr:DUF2147 domain-containing protein [Pedobacter sp.]
MVKNLSFILFLLAFTATTFAQSKDAVLGKWLNAAAEGQIEIYKRGDKYFGKLVWIKEPNDKSGKPKTDQKNPNANLRSKPILGLEILKDFVFEEGRWTGGSVYDPKTGKTYSCNLSLKEDGQLNMRGYIGVSLIGRSESWKRVK